MGLNSVLVGGALLAGVAAGSTTPSVHELAFHGFRPGTGFAGGVVSGGRHSLIPLVRSFDEFMPFETDDADTRVRKYFPRAGTQTGEHAGQILSVPNHALHSVREQPVRAILGSHDAPVVQSPQARSVAWIRQATELSRKRIGELVGVTRQSVHAWEGNDEISIVHLERLLGVQDVLQRAHGNHPTPKELCAWLVGHPGGAEESPASLLARGEVDRARMLAVLSPTPGLEPVPGWVGVGTIQRWQEKGEPLDEAYPESEPELPPAFRGSWVE